MRVPKLAIVSAAVLLGLALPAGAAAPKTILVSKTSGGVGGDDNSSSASVSATGGLVAFSSAADNLSGSDSDIVSDVFVRNRQTGNTTLVSKTSGGVGGDGNSFRPSISADGRFVAFDSFANNLSGSDSDFIFDVFVHDRKTGNTTLVSKTSGGVGGDGGSLRPSISADGRFVAFSSDADNLSGADDDSVSDVFVHNRQTGNTMLVSKTSGGVGGDGGSFRPSISADGRFVAFESEADNLSGADDNAFQNIFVHDRQTGNTTLVSKTSGGVGANETSSSSSISADGRLVAFGSGADNLSGADDDTVNNVFVHNRQTGNTTLVSKTSGGVGGDGASFRPSISSGGRFVAFESAADNLSGADDDSVSDIFRHDRQSGKTILVSRTSGGVGANGDSFEPSISADGRFVAFESVADNLSGADDNSVQNVFLRGPLAV